MTKPSFAVAAVVVAASFAASCSDTTVVPTRGPSSAANLARDPDILVSNGRHLFHTRQWHDADNAAHGHGGGGGGGPSNNGIFYHGGPVLQSGTNVVAIYWSTSTIYNGGPKPGTSGPKCVDGSLVGTFLGNLAPSPYFNINST